MPGPRPLIKMRARFNKHAPQKYGIVLQNKVGRPAEVVIQVGKYALHVHFISACAFSKTRAHGVATYWQFAPRVCTLVLFIIILDL